MSTSGIVLLIYMLCAALLFAGAAFAARRRAKEVGARGPGMLVSLLIWGGIIFVIVVIIQGAAFWTALGSLFS
jgi:hypothetical protein